MELPNDIWNIIVKQSKKTNEELVKDMDLNLFLSLIKMPTSYYQRQKHIYRERYLENKRKEEQNYLLFKKYNGEKEYYRQQYIKAGFYKTMDSLIQGVDTTPVVGVLTTDETLVVDCIADANI